LTQIHAVFIGDIDKTTHLISLVSKIVENLPLNGFSLSVMIVNENRSLGDIPKLQDRKRELIHQDFEKRRLAMIVKKASKLVE
jgi:primosomal protein N''